VLPERNVIEATEFAEQLCAAIAGIELHPEAGAQQVTVSIGVASFSAVMANVGTLLAAADAQLYLAKQGGRNRVCSTSSV
jgi:diguanylate cyclase (GGDEF)-like protein